MDEQKYPAYRIAFSTRLRSLIDGNGITAKDFADMAEIPDASVYRYLNLDRVPKIDNVIIIAQYFGVSVDWLLGLSDDKSEKWSPEILSVAERYSIASPADRKVVDAVLEKYSHGE